MTLYCPDLKKRARGLHTNKQSLELCKDTTELIDYPFCDTVIIWSFFSTQETLDSPSFGSTEAVFVVTTHLKCAPSDPTHSPWHHSPMWTSHEVASFQIINNHTISHSLNSLHCLHCYYCLQSQLPWHIKLFFFHSNYLSQPEPYKLFHRSQTLDTRSLCSL